jgi:C-terminal processing protease CtpA/Prc
VVLQDPSAGAPAELMSGVLQLAGRAKVVGQPVKDTIKNYALIDLDDGSQVKVANGIFQPKGKLAGYFEQNGIQPDVLVPGTWNQYTPSSDPLLARAVDLLMGK